MIRHAVIEDLPAIKDIWNYYILNTTYNYDYEPKSLEFLEEWFHKKATLNLPVFVVEEEGRLVGYGAYSQFRERNAYAHSAEHGLYFHPDFHGKGLGRELLNTLLADGKERGFHTFIAVIDSSNEGSVIFHEKMGFEKIGQIKEVGRKNGQWLNLVLLQKIITGSFIIPNEAIIH
ncbi:GNAT family N-acetyltransferase [Chitinophaga sancti]|uniref:N-acetyltransferase family protein n=1 Tax=Chitinophaga sancti TaxID=1004 RepID=A0A1K1MYC5_9BACT|nr:GNAT family N-acetyltransferase [Chitinophaga sancti]WQD63085.1 N-acetyltransferase family protein [Chitinophaga sancti]WQG91290.1 N-acetyltransferase family protein [Chitinophaga sancti]SFW28115.1 phosphinothricin acetyltransferase [Chitinophaga sancti]